MSGAKGRNITLADKGELLYETPPDSPLIKIGAILIHLIILTIFVFINIIFVLFILFIIVVGIAGAAGGGVATGSADLLWLGDLKRPRKIMNLRYIHRRMRIYEHGITYPLGEIRSLLFPSKEGRFIPKEYLRGFECAVEEHICIIYFHGKLSLVSKEVPHVKIINNRVDAIHKLGFHLEQIGIPRIPYYCPKCGSGVKLRETCVECKTSRF